MEAVGAVASIVQIAQLGAQLSITLYKIAETVGSANKDVQYVAKDIALFSAVLKDLGKTLETGQKLRLYRYAAYESSRLIVKECEEVFREIESILNKSTKDGGSLDTNVSLPRIQKFMWVFRKSRVHLLRGNLESLKSTILLQVAVLSYSDKVSMSINEVDATDELLALKSLVLAEDTAKREFQELVNKSIPSSDHRNTPYSNSFDTAHGSQVSDQNGSTTSQNPFISTMATPIYQFPNHSHFESRMLNKVSLSNSEATNKYAQIWPVLDRLELALKKLEVARWQHDPIQDNLQLGPKHYAEYYYRGLEANFLQRLERDLTSFGLSKLTVEQAIASLKMHDAGVGLRAQVKHTISKDDALLQTLQSLGASLEYDQVIMELV